MQYYTVYYYTFDKSVRKQKKKTLLFIAINSFIAKTGILYSEAGLLNIKSLATFVCIKTMLAILSSLYSRFSTSCFMFILLSPSAYMSSSIDI